MIWVFVLLTIVLIILFAIITPFGKIVKQFDYGSCCVTGMRGSGKDMLVSNVVARRDLPYVSNVEYKYSSKCYEFYPFEYDKINVNNRFENFVSGKVNNYIYPYPDGTDIYISDVGVYLPSQYCNELNKVYPSLPVFVALSRHLGLSNMHFNVQNLNRAWDKIREMSETYYYCRSCKVLFGKIVIQKITEYDKAQSCQDRVKPCKISVPLFANRQTKEQIKMYREKFFNQYGKVKNHILVYVNKSSYDTRHFKKVLGGDVLE